MKNMLDDYWRKIPQTTKLGVKNYLIECLSNDIILTIDDQVVTMMILLLAKLIKLSWLEEDTSIRSAIAEIPLNQVHNLKHKLICLKAIEQTIVEMTYNAKSMTSSINRRTSVSFRDIELKNIFEMNMRFLTEILDLGQ